MIGPLPALMSWVKIVSITSSLSARPPQVWCASPRRAASSISRKEPVLGVRLGDVDDEEVREHQLGQRVAAVPSGRPVGLAVEPVPEREVGVQAGPVRAQVGVARAGTRPPCCRGRGSRGRGSPGRTASAPASCS